MNLFKRGAHRQPRPEATVSREGTWERCVCTFPEELVPAHVDNVWTCPVCGTGWYLVGITYRKDGHINSAHWDRITISDDAIAAFLTQAEEA